MNQFHVFFQTNKKVTLCITDVTLTCLEVRGIFSFMDFWNMFRQILLVQAVFKNSCTRWSHKPWTSLVFYLAASPSRARRIWQPDRPVGAEASNKIRTSDEQASEQDVEQGCLIFPYSVWPPTFSLASMNKRCRTKLNNTLEQALRTRSHKVLGQARTRPG